MEYETSLLTADPAGIQRAAELIRAGACVAFPTETVYGLGADARNDAAVAGIYAAKGRPSHNPLIVHLADAAMAADLVEMSGAAKALADAFWPGPLTLVLPLESGHGLSSHVTAGLATLAVRVPENQIAQDLLRAVGGPVAAPSANPSGRVSPTRADHVMAGLGGRIAAVLDGGACPVGVESTIVGLTPEPSLLRPGGLPVEVIEAALGQPLHGAAIVTNTPNAPGQLASHYAPKARVRLNATAAEPGEVLLGFGDVQGDLTLSASGDLHEAAASLYDHLRALDRADIARIAVAPIPDQGLGRAINDRLARAAAPRD